MKTRCLFALFPLTALLSPLLLAQQPPEPVDVTPIDGEMYYVINQESGQQVDLATPKVEGGAIVQKPRDVDPSQRWAFNRFTDGDWRISNIKNGFCLDSHASIRVVHGNGGRSRSVPGDTGGPTRRVVHGGESTVHTVVQNPCAAVDTQHWALTPTGSGYYAISNKSTGLVVDLAPAPATGTPLV